MPPTPAHLENLPHVPAADVKKRGWRGVMRTMHQQGAVLVTNHNQPEAVIIPATEYARFLEMADEVKSRAASELDALRLQFDERLAALRSPHAGGRLRSVMRGPARLRGKVKAGTGY